MNPRKPFLDTQFSGTIQKSAKNERRMLSDLPEIEANEETDVRIT
jgi:hypothetical protein